MNYFQFHIGDYRAATAHLSNEEDLAYRRLIEMYYDTEKPIPLDTQWVAKRLRVDSEVVKVVLQDMFCQTESGWSHKRCDSVIEQYHSMAEKNRANGRLGGRNKNPVATDWEPSAKATNNHKPITNNQLIEDAGASLAETRFPPCPQQALIDLWKKKLPHLPQPRVWEGARQGHMRARWVQAAKPSSFYKDVYNTIQSGLAWWESFFAYIADDTTLSAGYETQGRRWVPDLVWVVNPTNFQKIIDGKYQK